MVKTDSRDITGNFAEREQAYVMLINKLNKYAYLKETCP